MGFTVFCLIYSGGFNFIGAAEGSLSLVRLCDLFRVI